MANTLEANGLRCAEALFQRLRVPGNTVAAGWDAVANIAEQGRNTPVVYQREAGSTLLRLTKVRYTKIDMDYGDIEVDQKSRTVLEVTDADNNLIGLVDSKQSPLVEPMYDAVVAAHAERGAAAVQRAVMAIDSL